jgi:hypothetical protein
MLTKHLLKISLLPPLMAVSATAYAGSTITDKSYWPSEARQSAQTRTVGSQSDLNSAFAYDRASSRLQPATNPNVSGSSPRYQGGPKSR